jgi:hypothetical protein
MALAPCFQEFISQNPALIGRKHHLFTLYRSAQKGKYLPTSSNAAVGRENSTCNFSCKDKR